MTPNREDYLKLIFESGGDEVKVNNKQIVSGLGVSTALIGEMISKLVEKDLVEHSSYQGVQLTEKGLEEASTLICKHRIWGVFLVEHLNCTWNDVHEEAEVLEHVTSQTLVNRSADYLSHPESYPRDGVIPEDNQPIHEEKRQTLIDYPVGTKIRIAYILDEKELLGYLVSIDLNIREEYTIKEIAAYEGPIAIYNENKELPISFKAANTILIKPLVKESEEN